MPQPTPPAPRQKLTRRAYLITLISLFSIVLIPLSVTSPAQAEPAPVNYRVSGDGTSLSVNLQHGTFQRDGNTLSIRDDRGAVVFQMPLSYRMESREFPISAQVTDRSATLTPSRQIANSRSIDPQLVEPVRAAAVQQGAAGPATRQERDDAALARFNQELQAGMTISSIVGIVIGAVVGGIAGCVLSIPIGCLPGIPLGASLGSVAGVILGGGGTMIVAGYQYLQTINSPFTPPRN